MEFRRKIQELTTYPMIILCALVGLIALVSAKVGRSYTNRALLTFNETILDAVCKLRFDY